MLVNRKIFSYLFLALIGAAFFAGLGFLIFFKYNHGLYNEMDLAIYNQTLFNAGHGLGFYNTVQQQPYFGDHFEPYLFLLLPLYKNFFSPLVLLWLQLLFLAAAAIPFYLLCRQELKNRLIETLFVFAFLFNVAIWAAALHGFHMLALAPFFLLFAFYFYNQNNFAGFLVFLISSFLVREDVGLVGVGWALLAFIQKRDRKWIWVPFFLGTAYFLGATQIIGFFNEEKTYKFSIYYGWLGSDFFDIVKNMLWRPGVFIKHFLTLGHLQFWVAGLLFFLGLPVLGARYLLPVSFIYIAFLLNSAGLSYLIWQTHYGLFFLPFFCAAFIFGWQKLVMSKKEYQGLFIWCLLLTIIYNFIALGPGIYFFKQWSVLKEKAVWQQTLQKQVSADGAVLSSDTFLAPLSSRPQIYTLSYFFTGHKQFSKQSYDMPALDYLLFDGQDWLTYYFQAQDRLVFPKDSLSQAKKLRQLTAEQGLKAQAVLGPYVLFSTYGQENFFLYQVWPSFSLNRQDKKEINDRFYLLKSEKKEIFAFGQAQLKLSLYFETESPVAENYFLKTVTKSADKNIHVAYYPLAQGFYQTSEFVPGVVYETVNYICLPTDMKQTAVELFLVSLKGSVYLDNLGSVNYVITEEKNTVSLR